MLRHCNDTPSLNTQKFKGARPSQNIGKGRYLRAFALANCARDATHQQQGFGSHEAFPALAAKTLGAFPKHMLAFWPIPERRAFTSFCFRMFWKGLSLKEVVLWPVDLCIIHKTSQAFTKEGVTLHGDRGPCYPKKCQGWKLLFKSMGLSDCHSWIDMRSQARCYSTQCG